VFRQPYSPSATTSSAWSRSSTTRSRSAAASSTSTASRPSADEGDRSHQIMTTLGAVASGSRDCNDRETLGDHAYDASTSSTAPSAEAGGGRRAQRGSEGLSRRARSHLPLPSTPSGATAQRPGTIVTTGDGVTCKPFRHYVVPKPTRSCWAITGQTERLAPLGLGPRRSREGRLTLLAPDGPARSSSSPPRQPVRSSIGVRFHVDSTKRSAAACLPSGW
jgi:hypothetical protein